jgi:hypothetical protein
MRAAPRRDHESFEDLAQRLVRLHPIVRHNDYTRWFRGGGATRDEVRHLTVQFSVFSHEFVLAQLRKVIHSADREAYRAGKEILLNELGVAFTPSGSVDGGTFRFSGAHFEWLIEFGAAIDLGFSDLGRRRHATPATLAFCDALQRLYASEEASLSEGASFAIEHWAAAGFWKELIAGLRAFQRRECPSLPLGFWIWHDQIEEAHAAHTGEELALRLEGRGFEPDRFLCGAQALLDAVKSFWDGLFEDHLASREGGR